MNLSYWEIKSWLTNVDFTIVGSGIVGLNCALYLKEEYPKANILILERGFLPQGASTKNAGFACFGSLSEIINDLKSHTEEDILQLVKKRVDGLQLLRSTLGDKTIDFQKLGGFELFNNDQLFDECKFQKDKINRLLNPIFNTDVFSFKSNQFGFKNIQNQYSFNPFEGQIDTGKMMLALLEKVQSKGIKILNSILVQSFENENNSVNIKTNQFNFKTSKLIITTNGFASEFIEEKVKPARAQVLITKPIKGLAIKGSFHLDRGYYYFRNIDRRVLLGGGRNLDIKGEETTKSGHTKLIQSKLEDLLKTVILPDIDFKIEHWWSGIMGVGNNKSTIVKQLDNNVF